MTPFAQLSCLSCQEMHELEKHEFKTYPEKRFQSLKLASLGVVKDLLKKQTWLHTLILAGPGGNGADAWAISTLLKERGWDPWVVHTKTHSPLCEQMKQEALKNGVRHVSIENFFKQKLVNSLDESSLSTTHALFNLTQLPHLKWDLIIDGFLGIGANRALDSKMASIIEWVNKARCQKIALDCPSGWSEPTNGLFQADVTYCFHSIKQELLKEELRESCGQFKIINVGFEDPRKGPQILTSSPIDLLPAAKLTWNKYSRGSVYLAVGSDPFEGSSQLAQEELWKKRIDGAPLVGMVYTLRAPTHPQSVQWDLSKPKTELSSLVIGSGMSISHEPDNFSLQKSFEIAPHFKAVILDAAALDYLRMHERLWDLLPPFHTLLTPHVGEARRLFSTSKEAPFEVLLEKAKLLAQQKKVWILLKNYCSHLLGPDQEHWIEPFGGPHLAVAGTGDQLAALIAASSLHLPLETAVLLSWRIKSFEKEPV